MPPNSSYISDDAEFTPTFTMNLAFRPRNSAPRHPPLDRPLTPGHKMTAEEAIRVLRDRTRHGGSGHKALVKASPAMGAAVRDALKAFLMSRKSRVGQQPRTARREREGIRRIVKRTSRIEKKKAPHRVFAPIVRYTTPPTESRQDEPSHRDRECDRSVAFFYGLVQREIAWGGRAGFNYVNKGKPHTLTLAEELPRAHDGMASSAMSTAGSEPEGPQAGPYKNDEEEVSACCTCRPDSGGITVSTRHRISFPQRRQFEKKGSEIPNEQLEQLHLEDVDLSSEPGSSDSEWAKIDNDADEWELVQ